MGVKRSRPKRPEGDHPSCSEASEARNETWGYRPFRPWGKVLTLRGQSHLHLFFLFNVFMCLPVKKTFATIEVLSVGEIALQHRARLFVFIIKRADLNSLQEILIMGNDDHGPRVILQDLDDVLSGFKVQIIDDFIKNQQFWCFCGNLGKGYARLFSP